MKKNFILFIVALTIIFGFITTLQMVKGVLFFGALVLMHCGVILYIYTKKQFKKNQIVIKKHYTTENILMALYLPVLAAKLLSNCGVITIDNDIKRTIVFCITGVAVVVSIVNCVLMYKSIQNQTKNS